MDCLHDVTEGCPQTERETGIFHTPGDDNSASHVGRTDDNMFGMQYIQVFISAILYAVVGNGRQKQKASNNWYW